ncbi:MAG: hypothetical protein AAGF53_18980 [Pseudomonadota bacterium]
MIRGLCKERLRRAKSVALSHGMVKTLCALNEALLALEGAKTISDAKQTQTDDLATNRLGFEKRRGLRSELLKSNLPNDVQRIPELCWDLCAFAVAREDKFLFLSAAHCTDVFYDEYLSRGRFKAGECDETARLNT